MEILLVITLGILIVGINAAAWRALHRTLDRADQEEQAYLENEDLP